MALTSEKTTTETSISAFGKAQSTVEGTPLNAEELRKIHAFWRACNYLAISMIYLRDNPLLRSPLKIEQIKHRILGHWGSSPGLSFVYTHLNRLIKQQDLNMIFLAGPGHGAPGVLGPCYLEGTYSEIYPDKSAVMVGDGESETGPLATAWHSNKFINPIRDGAVLPILHLNGYKINNPTILARVSHEELENLFKGYGYTPYFVEGSDPETMHQAIAATLDHCIGEIKQIQGSARSTGVATRSRWPMIVLRSPKGWTCPKEIDGHKIEGFWRAHQVPMSDVAKNEAHFQILEQWMRSYKPEELFDFRG